MALAALTFSGGRLAAGDLYKTDPAKGEPTVLPSPADVQALAVYPAKIALKGNDDAQQLLLTARSREAGFRT